MSNEELSPHTNGGYFFNKILIIISHLFDTLKSPLYFFITFSYNSNVFLMFFMSLLQIEISDDLKAAIKEKAKLYGITTSAMVRIVLVNNFAEEGNIFNANMDNNGKGMPVDALIQKL